MTTTWQDLAVDSAGVRLAVRDYGGAGQPIVLIHGHVGNIGNFEGFAPLLTPHFRVVSYDQRGHGQSESGPVTMSAFVDDLAAVIETLRLDVPLLYGGSFGTLVALAYIHAGREVRGFVSEDGRVSDFDHSRPAPAPPAEARRILVESALQQVVVAFADYGIAGRATIERSAVPLEAADAAPGTVELLPTQADLHAKEVAFSRLPVVGAYRACRAPILLLAATPEDGEARRKREAEIAALGAAVPVQVRWFPTRHWISADDPQGVADAIVEFISGPQ